MMSQNNDQPSSGTRIVLYALGVATLLAGVISFASADSTMGKSVGMGAMLGGLLVLILTYTGYTTLAKYITTVVIIVLSGAATIQQPIDVSLLGYGVAITLAGVLIDHYAVIVATVTSVVIFMIASFFSGTVDANSIPSIVVTAIGFALTGTLMAVFARSQRAVAEEAKSQAVELSAALAELRQKQSIEQQTGGAIVGIMDRLRQISDEQLASSHQQVTALAQVTATIEELSQAALQIATSAENVNGTARLTLDEASRSQEEVNESLQAMLLLKVQVQQIVQRTVALNQKIQGISDVNSTVSSLAAQTHLLALNAAIEAAGAGAAGERFAKVAGEVKKLAQRSQEEAMKIRELIQEVQRANAASVMATEQGLKDSDKGAARARAVAEATMAMIDNVGMTTSQMSAITMASQQQRSASAQVVDTMYHLKIAAGQVANSAVEINKTVAELSALAAQLGVLIQSVSEAPAPAA